RKGLFAELHPDAERMDESIRRLADTLMHYNPDAMAEMKKIFWHGTEHWDKLLIERAAISGSLALSSFTKKAIEKFKSKPKI
ncbi:MAG: enoyl-CoA hydratase/isomerase family protein, partial [Chitinophagaceae bacterium]